jgi:hypothetical protein
MGMQNSGSIARRESAVSNDHILELVHSETYDQPLSVIALGFKSDDPSAVPHKATCDATEESDVRTDIPERHTRSEEPLESLLNWLFMRTGPVVFFLPRINQEPHALSRTRNDDDAGWAWW